MIEHHVPVEADFGGNPQSLRLSLYALKLDTVVSLHHVDALQTAEEIEVPPGPAELAVGNGFQANRLLLPDDIADRFTDLNERVIDVLANIYPWEWLFVEEFGPKIPRSGTRFIEPAWKAMLSTKAILPLLWERHPGHPNLLPSYFEGDSRACSLTDFVRKPLFSREGANISLHRGGTEVERIPGPYGEQPAWVVQEAANLFSSEHGYAVLGSWIVGDEPCGLGMREDASPITMNLSRFVPHIIVDEAWRPERDT